MSFSIKEVRCYTQKAPNTFTNLCFYFTFKSKIDRFSFSSDYAPENKKFRGELLTYIQKKVEEATKGDPTALSCYLDDLESRQPSSNFFYTFPTKPPMDVLPGHQKNSPIKSAPADVCIFFSILQSLPTHSNI
jgi:hypothetical protein